MATVEIIEGANETATAATKSGSAKRATKPPLKPDAGPASGAAAATAPSADEITEVEQVIFRRRSTRKYKSRQVPEHLLRRLLEAGRFAPSAGNCQPWRFIVIQRREMIDEMENSVKEMLKPLDFLKTAPPQGWAHKALLATLGVLRINTADLRPVGGITEIIKGNLKVFHGAPTVILVLKDNRGVSHPDFDVALASQNMVLTAHALGLGTCYVGFVELLKYNFSFLKKMEIAWPWEIAMAITVGFPKLDSDGIVQRDQPQVDWYDDAQSGRRLVH